MALIYPLILKIDKKIYPLYVNPEKLSIKRVAKIGEARTFGGTVLRPWTNQPDELSISGSFYGLRGIADLLTFKESIKYNPENKRIELIYKYQSYPGFVRDFDISADSENPFLFRYNLNFISLKSFALYSLMIGNLPGLEADVAYFRKQAINISNRFRNLDDIGGANFSNVTLGIGYFLINKNAVSNIKKIFSKENLLSSISFYTLGLSGFLKKSGPAKQLITGLTLLFSVKNRIDIEGDNE